MNEDSIYPIFQFALRDDLVGGANADISFLPTRANDRATGWDVRAAFTNQKPIIIRAGTYVKIPLGFRVLAPDGWWLELRPRSSTFGRKQIHALYGVIDEDFEGECLFVGQYMPDVTSMGNDLMIQFGEAIGQIIPVQRQRMDVKQISNKVYDRECKKRNAQRGAGGFGSTDKK